MTFSISRDGQLYLLKAIFRPRCMVLVWITIKDRVSVKSLRVRVRLRVSVSRLDVVWGWKIANVMYICQSRMESNTKRLVLGFQVFYSVLLQTTNYFLRATLPLRNYLVSQGR